MPYVFVANPKYVKGIRRKNTDKRDLVWALRFTQAWSGSKQLHSTVVDPSNTGLMRYRYKLTNIAHHIGFFDYLIED